MSTKYHSINNLKVSEILVSFVNEELLKDIGISSEKFWLDFDKIVHELAPINKKLIEKREILQKKIDSWHIKNKGNKITSIEYKKFLKEIGYLVEEGPSFEIETNNIENCSIKNIQNILKEFYKRFIIPFYIPILSLIPFLLITTSKENSKYNKLRITTFLIGFFIYYGIILINGYQDYNCEIYA